MTTPDAIATQALRIAGDGTPLRSYEPVGGGMISQTARVVGGRGAYLLKKTTNSQAAVSPYHSFAVEPAL